jgi:hypothetical protein
LEVIKVKQKLHDPLVNKLVEIQEEEELSDTQMADVIGCSRQIYQATRTGNIPAGQTVLKGVLKTFPQLKELSFQSMANGKDIEKISLLDAIKKMLGLSI